MNQDPENIGKIGIVGPSGAGKSSFLKVLRCGEFPSTTAVTVGISRTSEYNIVLEDRTIRMLDIQDFPGCNKVYSFGNELAAKHGIIFLFDLKLLKFSDEVLNHFMGMKTQGYFHDMMPVCIVFNKADLLDSRSLRRRVPGKVRQFVGKLNDIGFRRVGTFFVSSLETRQYRLESDGRVIALESNTGVKEPIVWLTKMLFQTENNRVMQIRGELYDGPEKIQEHEEFLPHLPL